MRPLKALLVLVLALASPLLSATTAWAMPPKLSPNGQVDFQYGNVVDSRGGPATAQKPESKLFYTGDGSTEPVRWWGVFGTGGAEAPSAGVWLWELVDHDWVSRLKLNADAWMKADVVFDGSTAYVSLRDNGTATTGNPRQSLLYRIPYVGDGAWGTVPGPSVITTRNPETLTIAKDSAGRLWSTFEEGRKIKVGYTAPGGSSFTFIDLPVAAVTSDDISTITAFGGDRIGVAWSNQATFRFHFAWRDDQDPIGAWTIETAYGGGVAGCPTANGTRCADDHLNIAVSGDEVYAAVKTSLNDQSGTSGDPLIALLRRDATGSWQSFPVSPVSQDATRPIVVLSPGEDAIHVFANRGSEVDVWESELASPSFDPGAFSVWVKTSLGTASDPTATKQATGAATGTVVLTSVNGADTYVHNEFLPSGQPPPPTTPPIATSANVSTTEDQPVPIQLSGTDVESCELTFSVQSSPTHGSLGAMTNEPCSPGAPNTDGATLTYTPAPNFDGSDSFTFRVNDGSQWSTPATVSITVTGQDDPPTAMQGSASTTADTPTQVQLTGTDPDTCELTFTVETGPVHGSLGSMVDASCSQGAPNSDRASITYTPDPGYTGSDSFTFSVSDGSSTSNVGTISIAVTEPGDGISFRSVSSGTNSTATTLSIDAPTGTIVGDVMIAVVDVRGTPVITPPSGWSLVRIDEISTTMRQGLYVRVATGSEPPSYTWTFSKSQTAAGAILAYSGVDTTAPIDVHAGAVNEVASSTVVAPSISPSGNGEMVVAFFGITGLRSFTLPADLAERSDVGTTGATYPISSATGDVLQISSGSTGDKVATASGTGKSVGQLLALRPAA